jgi:hypothetical protein
MKSAGRGLRTVLSASACAVTATELGWAGALIARTVQPLAAFVP